MTNQDNHPIDPADLRQKAEALVRERTTLTSEDSTDLSPEDIRKTLHELRVHQIELELQNQELRHAQIVLEESRARYFDLYDLAPVGYLTLSEKGLILETNLTASTLLGTTRGMMIKQPISRFIFKEDQDIYYLHRKKLFEGGEPQECELRLVKPNGPLFWAHLTATTAQAKDGSPVCRCALNDISRRKQAEHEKEQAEQRFRLMFMNAPMPYQSLDEQGNFLDVNQTFLNVLGYSREELIGKNFGDILHPDWREHFKENFPKFKAVGEILGVEFEMVKKDGSTILVYFNGKIQRDDQDRFVRTHCIFQDVTERKRAEDKIRVINKQLQHVNAEKDKLLAIIAHDLRSPLSGVYSASRFLAEEAETLSLEKTGHIASTMHKSSKDVFELLEDLLQWARMSQGGMDFSPEKCTTDELVNSSLDTARDMAGSKGIAINADIPQNLVVLVDQPMIKTVIRNVIFNAVKFTPPGGHISVTARETGSNVEVCVLDDGIGMNEAIMSEIFSVDKNKRQLGTDGEKGTGLGMILCREFVEKHGGKIWLESERGQGTKVFFTLPAAS